ncbi:MAG TPA: hypothetical protein VMF69_21825 [Gemmataceae bacterium]|nr:hypothetical protein [Gemmataceae bacterium]
MLPSLRPIGVAASLLAASLSMGCSLFSHRRSQAPPDAGMRTQVHSTPPLHEALASAAAGHSRHPVDVLYPPPAPLPERPSEPRPAGDGFVWAPGYWMWNSSEDNWLWVRGVWVHAPRGRRWTPGYWSIAADGWRWVRGYWAVEPPPPPYSPPANLANAPVNGAWYDNPGLVFFTGYGMWWPMYPYAYWPFYPMQHAGATAPVVASPGPHPAEHLPFPLPHLASNIHDAPATPPHLDMTSILASVPKPPASAFDPPKSFELHTAHPMFDLHPGSHEHAERISSLFSTAQHLESSLHDRLISHGDFAVHSSSGEWAHGSGGHGSEGHGGGGHGR